MPDVPREELLNQAIDGLLAGVPVEVSGSDLDALVRIAGDLRQMPSNRFRTALKDELEGRIEMNQLRTSAIREGFRTVTPYLTVAEGDKLIEFLKATFGAEELLREASPGGFHAEVRVGDSMLMIGSGSSVRGNERIGAFHVYVPDCDAACQRAVEAGGVSMGEPADQPYGERSGFVKDFAGNHWYIATRFAAPTPPEGRGTVVPYLLPAVARASIGFLKRAFAAEEVALFEDSGRIAHAVVRIGDSELEMGEPREPQSLSFMFFLYVEDCDGWYRRAIAAGATSLEEPADRTYGHRTATVLDPFGYRWVPASLIGDSQL